MNFPADLKYTKDHEWIRVEGDVAYALVHSVVAYRCIRWYYRLRTERVGRNRLCGYHHRRRDC